MIPDIGMEYTEASNLLFLNCEANQFKTNRNTDQSNKHVNICNVFIQTNCLPSQCVPSVSFYCWILLVWPALLLPCTWPFSAEEPPLQNQPFLVP